MSLEEHRYDSADELAIRLARWCCERLNRAIQQWGCASLIVSGGRSPLGFFQALRDCPVNWSQLWISLADERWLAPEHADSNEQLVRSQLLQGPAAQAKFISLYGGEATPEQGLVACRRRLAELPRPFDVVVLGMGTDGHTASLFADADEFDTALRSQELCLPIHPKQAPHARMSLSLSALLDSRELVILLQGRDKYAICQQARQVNTHPQQLPISSVLQQNKVPVHLFCSD